MYCFPLLPRQGQVKPKRKEKKRSLQRAFICRSGLLALLECVVLRVLCGCMSLRCLCSSSDAVEQLLCLSLPFWHQLGASQGGHKAASCVPRDVPTTLAILAGSPVPTQGTAATGTHLGALLPLLASFWMRKSISWAALSALVSLCCWCTGGDVRWGLADGQPSAKSSAGSDGLCLLDLFTDQ